MFVANQGRMFINARFRPTPAQDYTTWVRVCSILSILSLAFLVLTSGYFFHQLMNPCLTYKLLTPVPAATKHACHDVHSASFPGKVDCILSVITHPWREDTTGRNDGSPAICLTSADPSLGERLACMLPDIAYHPPATIKDECNGSTADTYFYWPLCVFVCAAVGAMVGLIFEFYLVCMGTPFNFDLTPMTASIVNIRHLIYGLVYCCIMLTTIALTVDPQKVPTEIPQLYLLFSHSASFLVGVLTITLYFQVDSSVVVVLGVGMISQLAWIFYQGTVFGGVVATRFLWCGVFIHLLGAILFEPNTPGASTMYHIFACVTGWCIYVALTLSGNDSPEYASNVAGALFPNGLYSLSLAICLVVGAIFALWASPKTYQAYRSMVSCMIWSVIYFLILANPMLLFKPYRLSEVYAKLGTRRLCVRPYSEQHVKYMPKMIGIPSISGYRLPPTVEIFAKVRGMITTIFAFMAWLGQVFPQADVHHPLRKKIRLLLEEDGSKRFPASFFSWGAKMPANAKTLQKTPIPMLEAFQDGTLLAYLCQYGPGNSFLRRATMIEEEYPYFQLVDHGVAFDLATHYLVLDFRHLEVYETKSDYEQYGGIAFFGVRLNEITQQNELYTMWVIGPNSHRKLEYKPNSATCRRIADLIRATLAFETIVAKHLVELHMAYNLLEGELQNVFDYGKNPCFQPGDVFIAHPFRLVLYIHLFSHGLATELTVGHLLQEGAIFSQIFALTYNSLCDYLTDTFGRFRFSPDEDFEERTLAMTSLLPQIQPGVAANIGAHQPVAPATPSFTCSLQWELEYHAVFSEYAIAVVHAIYADDAAVQSDATLALFVHNVNDFFREGQYMQVGHHRMSTREDVSRFLSDTIFHLTVKHQSYGTDAVTGALDPRINSSQIPRDGGAPAVDEWRALCFVAIATAYPAFSHLLPVGNDGQNNVDSSVTDLVDIFDDATPILGSTMPQGELVRLLKAAFATLQGRLRGLQENWVYNGNGEKHIEDENYMYFRCLPADLHTGPGF